MINSGQISRAGAMKSLEEPLYPPRELETDLHYFCKKVGISRDEFENIVAQPNRHYRDFPTWDRKYQLLKKTQALVERLTGRTYNVYS
jgi:hypothetical protein